MKINILVLFLLFWNLTTNAQKTFVVETNYLPHADTSMVFYPKQNHTFIKQNTPIVIMLHGYGGDYKQWSKITDLQSYANKYNCIIVCPDGGKDSWYFDSPIQRNSKFESFFINDYLPYLKENLTIDTNGIFITGLSMGGHGAMYLFLRHHELFASAGSTSGVLDLNASGLKYSSLSNKIGEYETSKGLFDKYSSINLLENIKFSEKAIIFDCGNKDHLYQANKDFKDRCDSLYINAFYYSFPGRHNRKYWKESIAWHFEFFNKTYNNKGE
ncbi:MAG: prolyl oligopeptidase family serine peptidase [Bacteroidales bacterium]|nr:prolyl oligopeptidase family serine peptidase [Bacteroidales bacterium]